MGAKRMKEKRVRRGSFYHLCRVRERRGQTERARYSHGGDQAARARNGRHNFCHHCHRGRPPLKRKEAGIVRPLEEDSDLIAP